MTSPPRTRRRSLRAFIRWAALGLGLAGAPRGASAQVSAADRATAEILFREAKALLDQNKLDQACPKLAESQRLEPKPGTILNLAMCHERQGKVATAWADFMEAASFAAKEKQIDREKYARTRVAALEPTLPRLVISVEQAAPGTDIKLDGRALGEPVWGTALPIDPGDHAIDVGAPGRVPWSLTLKIAPGPGTKRVTVPPLDQAKAAPAGGVVSGVSGRRLAGIVVGGVGVAGIVVGSIFGLRTFAKKAESDKECDGPLCSQKGLDLSADARRSGIVSTVAFGVGIAGLGVGLFCVITGGSTPAPGAARKVWIAPRVGLGSASLSVGGAL